MNKLQLKRVSKLTLHKTKAMKRQLIEFADFKLLLALFSAFVGLAVLSNLSSGFSKNPFGRENASKVEIVDPKITEVNEFNNTDRDTSAEILSVYEKTIIDELLDHWIRQNIFNFEFSSKGFVTLLRGKKLHSMRAFEDASNTVLLQNFLSQLQKEDMFLRHEGEGEIAFYKVEDVTIKQTVKSQLSKISLTKLIMSNQKDFLNSTNMVVSSIIDLEAKSFQDADVIPLTGHTDEISDFTMTSSKGYLATKSKDETIRVWDTIEFLEFDSLICFSSDCDFDSYFFREDNRYLFRIRDGRAQIIDIKNSKIVHSEPISGNLSSISWPISSKTITLLLEDGKGIRTTRLIHFESRNSGIEHLNSVSIEVLGWWKLDRSGNNLAYETFTGEDISENHDINILDVRSGDIVNAFQLSENVQFTVIGKSLLVAEGGLMKSYSLLNGELLNKFSLNFPENLSFGWIKKFDYTNLIVGKLYDEIGHFFGIIAWQGNVENGIQVNAQPTMLAYLSNDRKYLLFSESGEVRMYDISAAKILDSKNLEFKSNTIQGIKFEAGTDRILVWTSDFGAGSKWASNSYVVSNENNSQAKFEFTDMNGFRSDIVFNGFSDCKFNSQHPNIHKYKSGTIFIKKDLFASQGC